ncbi:Gastrin/cholecystokinin-like peptide [Acipenser ruthenus]|uniref:Gastrin n=1 Tax=Acipenser ruthenus TaxID=7906 RepID=A0A444UKA3_ACIRT|nr:Gastrin/cholecystokinin-like peptide [Acipenser ruthenus]
MSCVKVSVLVTVLALAVCVARPLSESRSEAGAALAQRNPQREKALAARIVRRDWMGSLTADQRQFMSKYIPHVLADMSCVKVFVLVTVLALAVCVARPLSESRSEAGAALAQRNPQREKALAARIVRRDWMGSLTADQRQFMSKYIPHVLAGYGPADSVHPIIDRDYAGWMDFGRRNTEDVEFDP